MSEKDMSGTDLSGNEPTTARRRNQRLAGAFGLLLAGAMAGGLLAATSSASAADTTTSVAAATPSPTAPAPTAPADRGRSVRPGETALTGADAEKAKAAALKAVPGGTVDRVETDADGATYEAHVTKADGSRVTVKLDKSFAVTSIEDGCGPGGPGGPGGRGGADRTRPTGGTAPTASGAAV